jgi:aspartate/tyrosine/aromatic aminotransferase
MFQNIELAPRDPILGLTEAFRADANPQKINLGVGVFQDEAGTTPILATVVEASKRIVASQTTKSYLPITGAPEYAAAVQELTFSAGHEVLTSKRAATAHTPGGTGALRVAGDFIAKNLPTATLWLSQPTWENHGAVFAAAGVPTKNYAYFDKATNGLAFAALLADIRSIPAGDVILLHGCCHNPTGIDPTLAQWKQIAAAVRERGVLPLLDFAYQGFGDGIVEDAAGLREFCQPNEELLICSSFSKNFGLYRERVGAITLVAANTKECAAAESQLKRCIRTNYSNPPAHGAEIVKTILADATLRIQWEGEVAAMRQRIHAMRSLLVKKLAEKGARGSYEFINRQQGMFSFSGLTPPQVDRLRDEYAIYMVGSGRINVAGITPKNVDRLCDAIVAVTG